MKALKIDGEIVGIWPTTGPDKDIARLGQVVEIEPCPLCHGAQYIEKKEEQKK